MSTLRQSRRQVSSAEQSSFVEAVQNGRLVPDATQVAYYFEEWLDKDIVDDMMESSSDVAEAVAMLSIMCPATSPEAEAEVPPPVAEEDTVGGEAVKNREAMTLDAIQAQRSSIALATASDQAAATAPADSETVAASSGKSNMKLEKVAAFIKQYAGDQDAASRHAASTSAPPASPFPVSPGTTLPRTKIVQMIILTTAEKSVELPGFEAFMKIQHGKDATFSFLKSDHALHSYYLFAKKHAHDKAMKAKNTAGQAEPGAASSQDPDVLEIMRMMGSGGP